MITSSKFFEKSFFTIDYNEQKVQTEQLSPWGRAIINSSIGDQQKDQSNSSIKIRNPQAARVYQISRNSSIKYVQRKLKAKSHMNKSKQLMPIQQSAKYYTLQQKLNSVDVRNEIKCLGSVQILGKLKRQKRKAHIFPQLTINQYNDIKAKGSGIMNNSNPIQQILERKKNRRRILEQFGKIAPVKLISGKKKQYSSQHRTPVLSGRYVCIARNPQLSVNGLPTTKFIDQY